MSGCTTHCKGNRVGNKNPEKEIGWYKIVLNDHGFKDDLFKDLPEVFNVFQWHGDTFGIPPRREKTGLLRTLSKSGVKVRQEYLRYPVSCRSNKNMIAQWADAYKEELESLKGVVSDKQKMLEDYDKLSKVYMKQAEQFYVNFFTIAGLLKKDIFLSTIMHGINP